LTRQSAGFRRLRASDQIQRVPGLGQEFHLFETGAQYIRSRLDRLDRGVSGFLGGIAGLLGGGSRVLGGMTMVLLLLTERLELLPILVAEIPRFLRQCPEPFGLCPGFLG
jgi:hypothetical protein